MQKSQSFQKWCHLNFDVGFEFGDHENPHDYGFLQIERIWLIYPKNCPHGKDTPSLDASKIFGKEPYPYVKFYKKHNGNVVKVAQSTILELCQNFMQKWGLEPSKMVPPQFWQLIPTRRPRKPQWLLFPLNRTTLINWFKKCLYTLGTFLGQSVEFVWLGWYGGCGGFCGRRIRNCRQNWGDTIFGSSELNFIGPGPHFWTKFGHNSRMVGRTDSATSPSCFSWILFKDRIFRQNFWKRETSKL